MCVWGGAGGGGLGPHGRGDKDNHTNVFPYNSILWHYGNWSIG